MPHSASSLPPLNPSPGSAPPAHEPPGAQMTRIARATHGRGEKARMWSIALARLIRRQALIEAYGLPGYGLTLRSKVSGFVAAPRDFRPVNDAMGRSILAGRFQLAGSVLDIQPPNDPWNRPSPTRSFAVSLHRFDWLASVMASGERGAREALRLTLGWDAVFGRWTPFAWGPEVLARRVFNLACAARRMAAITGEEDRERLARTLSAQARQLLRPPTHRATRACAITAAVVAGCALGGRVGERLIARGLRKLGPTLDDSVLPDGVHTSRSPEAGLELLLDLLTLEDALLQRAVPVPPAVSAAMDRLTLALRTLTLADGCLAAFQGGARRDAAHVEAARAHDEAPQAFAASLADGCFERLDAPLVQVMVDTGAPARGVWSEGACAQPLAIEVLCGRDRLITNSGWTPEAPERQALRLSAGGSTLTLGERSPGGPLTGKLAGILGPRLDGPALNLEVERRESEGAVLLEASHDGWVAGFGLVHQRRLYLDQKLDELRAEDRLRPSEGARRDGGPLAYPYALRFHLEPGVQASVARDRQSILLRGPSGRGWWFRSDGPDIAIEPSVHVVSGLTRRALQIVVRGTARADDETRIRWKLSPAGAAESG